jgi:hypothetical protein
MLTGLPFVSTTLALKVVTWELRLARLGDSFLRFSGIEDGTIACTVLALDCCQELTGIAVLY